MWKKLQREKLKAAPFPSAWVRILQNHFPLYTRLPEADREELHGHIQVSLPKNDLKVAADWR